jgi:hypothetical protein
MNWNHCIYSESDIYAINISMYLDMCNLKSRRLRHEKDVVFQVLTATSMKMAVFWDVVPCSLVDVYRCFRGTYCLHQCPDDGGSKYF